MHCYKKKKSTSMGTERSGSMTLEAALILPFLCFAFLLVFLSLTLRQAQFLWHTSVQKAGKELQLTALLSRQAMEVTGLQRQRSEALAKLPPEISSLLQDEAATELLAPYVLGRINHWYKVCTRSSPLLGRCIQHRRILLHYTEGGRILELDSRYETPVVFASLRGRDVCPLPLWIGLQAGGKEEGGEEDDDADSFWSWHNFKRGQFLRKEGGGNLPPSYPVIARFSAGEATMIKSIDLTAPTWEKPEALRMEVEKWSRQLLHFEGTTSPWGKEKIEIHPGMIHQRRLRVFIPENSPPVAKSVLSAALMEARAQGIIIDLIEKETSYRYQKKEEKQEAEN